MSTIFELMLEIDSNKKTVFYHKDTKIFDCCPLSEIELKNIDWNAKICEDKDRISVSFLSFKEINHKDIMSFYVRECVYDKEIRKKLFYILRRDNYVKPFIEELQNLNLFDDFKITCEDVYEQIFIEWAEEKGVKF